MIDRFLASVLRPLAGVIDVRRAGPVARRPAHSARAGAGPA